jgi:hypothetical protein
MKTNRSIDLSRRMYSVLLQLFPREHRERFGAEMLQVFTTQCREAHARHGLWSLLALWLRTLPDIGLSSLREHITSPGAGDGLLEAVPGKPLPWKGVALVLLPGLVFLVSQFAQLNGQDWFFMVLYRGAYVLILPVILVWIVTRKFPVWGLIPLGMLYRTFWEFFFQRFIGGWFGFRLPLPLDRTSVFTREITTIVLWVNKLLWSIDYTLQGHYNQTNYIVTIVMLVALVGLIVLVARKGIFSKTAWIWLATAVGISLVSVLLESGRLVQYASEYSPGEITDYILMYISWYLRSLAEVVILVLAGTLLLRRYGSLALLLPLGYMIPFVLYGRTTPEQSTIPFVVISLSVIAYRILLTLVAPVWILRTAGEGGQKRAFGVALITALLVSVALNIVISVAYFAGGSVGDWSFFFFAINTQLLNAAAIGLALALYQSPAIPGRPQPQLKLEPAEA